MSRDITDLIMTKYFIEEKEKKVRVLNKEIEELQASLVRKCDHPTTTTTENYFPGTYNDLSFVEVTQTCTICGTVLKHYNDPNHKGSHA